MIFEIVFGILAFVVGIVILTGKVDKWLIYAGKQINEKRLRLVRGVEGLLFGVWFIIEGCFGYNTAFFVPIAILFIVSVILQYTWCKKIPEN